MDENKKDLQPEDQITHQPGEKGFAIFLLLFGLFFTWQSLKLYQQSPGASSYGAVPLFCSVLISLMAVIILLIDRNKKSINTGTDIKTVLNNSIHHILSKDVVVMLVLMVIYCIALSLNIGFMLVTPVFLWVSMTYLGKGNIAKNLFWTAVCMIFIYLVFQVLFSVVLP